MRYFLPFALLPMFLASVVCAQNVTRTYDIRHLIIDVPNFGTEPDTTPDLADLPLAATTQPAGGGGGGLFGGAGGGAGAQPARDDDRQALVDKLLNATRAIVDGPADTKVDQLNGQLIVTAPGDRHDRIKAAVDTATRDRSRQVTLRAQFIQLPNEQVAKLAPAVRGEIDAAQFNPRTSRLLNDAQANELLKAIESANATLLTAPRVTLMNGQQAYVLVSTQQVFVADHRPVANKPGEFEPVHRIVQPGVLLEARVHATHDSVALQLHPQLMQLLEMQTRPWPAAPAGSKLTVQHPVRRLYEARSLLSLASGQWALLSLPVTDPATADPKSSHFLLVQATIVGLKREVEEKQFPLLSPKPAE